VCLAVFPDSPSDALGLLDEISGFAERILSLGDLNDFGIRDDVRISLNWDSGFGKSRTSVSLSRGQRIRSVSGCLVSVTGD